VTATAAKGNMIELEMPANPPSKVIKMCLDKKGFRDASSYEYSHLFLKKNFNLRTLKFAAEDCSTDPAISQLVRVALGPKLFNRNNCAMHNKVNS
jgi:hypothetical protein